jgi:hypothetical protein
LFFTIKLNTNEKNDKIATIWTEMLLLKIKKSNTQSMAKRMAIKKDIFDNIVKKLFVLLNCQTGHQVANCRFGTLIQVDVILF